MMTYPQRRTAALALAAAYDGWGRPPNPEGKAARFRIIRLDAGMGRKFDHRTKTWVRGQLWKDICVPNSPGLDAQQAAKERLQNRRHFS